ncbi:putative serine/threonine-protein kinase drkA [Phytophthora citrophthora]|uniref:Serine/threonine-protein kinase drkA n=1 Tax=Phytophthora citrophthora TaxID=4793 RepID=A0AAD9LD11_9STRA|nr:putative serine/threonine-protein kinase drkA [Phytophthora citrophthora]
MSSTGVGVVFIDCTSDYKTYMKEVFGTSPFILVEFYDDVSCENLGYAKGMVASGKCEGSPNPNSTQNYHFAASVESDGSAVIEYYYDSVCRSSQLMDTYTVDEYTLQTHLCDISSTKWYYSDGDNSVGSESGGNYGYTNESNKTSKVWYIILGVVLPLLFVGVGICCCKRKSHMKQTEVPEPSTTSFQTQNTSTLDVAVRGQVGLWDDDVITAKRIPRDKVRVKKLLSRGAFGEVYEGVFNGNLVAVKMLVPHTRGDLKHVNDFLAEAKLTATMDHPNIVGFVGVAWDALSDICVVLEFMENGDLRELLTKYEENHHPVGFDHQKTSIALQVCHALTYLHSLLPPVIHRDLKSRNILLSNAMEAKLTDFGISKERQDQTMTAGVGTSLWMAPEVMLGKRYDVKADIFSFGVVLSELDLHTLPYAQVKEQVRDSNGRKLPDAAILQQVAMGSLKVEFSQATPTSIVELGLACVSLNPCDRPTAAEALYRLQVILTKGLV